jgi:hypothetical protein
MTMDLDPKQFKETTEAKEFFFDDNHNNYFNILKHFMTKTDEECSSIDVSKLSSGIKVISDKKLTSFDINNVKKCQFEFKDNRMVDIILPVELSGQKFSDQCRFIMDGTGMCIVLVLYM